MILQRTSLYPQMRLDVPDARAIEAFGGNDWAYFLKGVVSSKSLIVSGFDVTNYQNIFVTSGVKIQCNNVALIHSEAKTQAQGFYVSAGTEADYQLVLNPSTTNYVEVDLRGVGGAPDVRAFWDPGANGGKGAEYTDTVDTVINLELDIKVNVSGFSSGAIPLYKITTDATGKVTQLTDCRPLMFRLASGGTSPDPTAEYQFKNLPDNTHARLETPVVATSATATNLPFQGGDKNIKSLKEWMDVVMTQLKQGMALPYWYMKPATSQAGAYQNAAMTLLTGGEWAHLGHASRAISATGTTLTVEEGAQFDSGSGVFEVNGAEYSYTSFSSSDQIFRGVSPSPSAIAAGSVVSQGDFGHIALNQGSVLVRLGQPNSSLLPFADIDLETSNTLYIVLSNDASTVAYSMGGDGTSPIKPKQISARTTNSITVATGGNYATGPGRLLIRGQEFSYTAYSDSTGLFTGVSPDPTGLSQIGDLAYQSNRSGTGYYHVSPADEVPGVTSNGMSEGVERTYWLAYYDGNATMYVRDTELFAGEVASIGNDDSKQLYEYIGSSGANDNFPIYNVNTITNGTNLTDAIQAAFEILETPIYDEILPDSGGTGWTSGVTIYLPDNSRADNAPASYTVGSGELLVYENGVLLREGYDYTESSSNSIQLLRDVFMGSYFRFRVANVGGAGAAAGNGAAGLTLNQAYQNGAGIVITPGAPVTIDGPGGEKLLHIKGDLQVDGLIDPTGLELTPQASTPIPATKSGIWIGTDGALKYTRDDGTTLDIGGVAEIFASSSQHLSRTKTNTTGATIPAGSPVYIKPDGTIGLADADNEEAATVFGIAMSSIPNGSAGKVIYQGVVPGVLNGLGLTSGAYLWLSTTPGQMSVLPPFSPGSYLRIIGIVDGDDLILQQQVNGQV